MTLIRFIILTIGFGLFLSETAFKGSVPAESFFSDDLGMFYHFIPTGAGLLWIDDFSVSETELPPCIAKAGSFESIAKIGDAFPGKMIPGIKNPENLRGNPSESHAIAFVHSPPVLANELIINELMIDPSPVRELPEAEYIELFNNTSRDINLKGCSLVINGTGKVLGEALVPGNGFLLLCSTGAAGLLKPYGSILSVPAFPGLLNKGASVLLVNDKDSVIDHIIYSDSWYGNPDKANGGWSLERIDPDRHCGQRQNWKASEDTKGGTPGKINSVLAGNADNERPYLRWATPLSGQKIHLSFSESMDTFRLKNVENYLIGNGTIPVKEVILSSPEECIVVTGKTLEEGKDYAFGMQNLTDECGNQPEQGTLTVQWSNPSPGDFVINEILFNPFPGGKDFVEIYNNSPKRIAFNRFFLATRDDSGNLKQVSAISQDKFTFEPATFLVCTTDSAAVVSFYYSPCPQCIITMNSMPGFSNEAGTVVLLDESMNVLDEFTYSEKMHHPVLHEVKGVSLERVNCSIPATLPSNWQSASASAGYATPGYKNSQSSDVLPSQAEVTIEPESFSPNNDGYYDELIIGYRFAGSGMVANCLIFDARGRQVTHLLKNETLGANGYFTWDGSDETGKKLAPGIYIVLLEVFDPSGFTKKFKDAVVLTGRME